MKPQIPHFFNPNFNQNLWGLFVALFALGIGEHYCLKNLKWFGLILSIVFSLSNLITLTAYTVNYWKKKFKA